MEAGGVLSARELAYHAYGLEFDVQNCKKKKTKYAPSKKSKTKNPKKLNAVLSKQKALT